MTVTNQTSLLALSLAINGCGSPLCFVYAKTTSEMRTFIIDKTSLYVCN